MERTQINSSNLVSIAYDTQWKILEIEFYNGSIYHYYDVPENVYNSLIRVSSKDQYFERNIKRLNYSFRKMK